MKPALFSIVIGAALAVVPTHAAETSTAVKHVIEADQSQLLNVLTKEVTDAPNQAGDIVKAAIESSKANPEKVGEIVKAAILAAPDQAEAICKCALAVAPDAAEQIELAVASIASSKDEVAAARTIVLKSTLKGKIPNPISTLDSPGDVVKFKNVIVRTFGRETYNSLLDYMTTHSGESFVIVRGESNYFP